MDTKSEYQLRKNNYKKNLLNEIEEHYKKGDLAEYIEFGQGHSDRHTNQSLNDIVHRAEYEFKAGTTFLSDEIKNNVLYTALKEKIDEIMDWKFGTVDKKYVMNINYDNSIGVGVNLFLEKFDISKATIVLKRDDINSKYGFNLTTIYPLLDKEAKKTNVKYKRKYQMPRLLPLYNNLDANYRKYYKLSMSKDGTRIKLDTLSGQKRSYMIELPSDTKEPTFRQYDKYAGSSAKINPGVFKTMEPVIFNLVLKYYNYWKTIETPKEKIEKQKRTNDLKIIKDYCDRNNDPHFNDYAQLYQSGDENLLNLVAKNINPDILLRKDLSNIMDLLITQLKINSHENNFYIDINKYTQKDKLFTHEQLEKILRIARLGIDTTLMENTEYTAEQMKAIGQGLKYNHDNPDKQINVNQYADPLISSDEMWQTYRETKYIAQHQDYRNNYTYFDGNYDDGTR